MNNFSLYFYSIFLPHLLFLFSFRREKKEVSKKEKEDKEDKDKDRNKGKKYNRPYHPYKRRNNKPYQSGSSGPSYKDLQERIRQLEGQVKK